MENENLKAEQPEKTIENAEKASVPAKNKFRIGYFILSLIPVAVLLEIQTLAMTPFLFVAISELERESAFDYSLSALEITRIIMDYFNEKYALYAYLAYAVAGILVFGFWYFFGFVKKNQRVRFKEVFGVKSIVAAVGFAFAMQFAINAAFTLILKLFPHALDSYMELIETSGLVDNFLITVVYAIFLGPILEELCLRGVTFGFLEKSGIKPIFVILVSGVLFGVMHMNLVQGIYASVLGFVIGYLRYKYRSVKLTICMHILFNFLGSYGMGWLEKIGLSDGWSLILGGISLFILVFCFVLVNGDKKAFKAPKEA